MHVFHFYVYELLLAVCLILKKKAAFSAYSAFFINFEKFLLMRDEHEIPKETKPKKKKRGKSQGIYLDKDVLDTVERKAKEDDRSISYVVNKALRNFFGLDKK